MGVRTDLAVEWRADGRPGPAQEAVVAAIKRIDQACAKGLMHKNCAARKKSQLALKLNKSNA